MNWKEFVADVAERACEFLIAAALIWLLASLLAGCAAPPKPIDPKIYLPNGIIVHPLYVK